MTQQLANSAQPHGFRIEQVRHGSPQNQQPQQQQTLWTNPTKHTLRIPIFISPGQTDMLIFEPGESGRVSSDHDGAIHVVSNGYIVGGLAPLLRREGQTYKIDPTLVAGMIQDTTEQLRGEIASKDAIIAKQGETLSALQSQMAELQRMMLRLTEAKVDKPAPHKDAAPAK